MATNVSEKDKTLQEVIDFLEKSGMQLITLLIIQTKKC